MYVFNRDQLESRIRLSLMVMVWVPGTLGSVLICWLSGFYTFSDLQAALAGPLLIIPLLLSALAALFVRPIHRKIVALAEQSTAPDRRGADSTAQSSIRLMFAMMLVMAEGYCYVLNSWLTLVGHRDFPDGFFLIQQMGIISAVMLGSMPAIMIFMDSCSRFLAPRLVGFGIFGLRRRTILYGLFVPFPVGMMMLAAFYNETGKLSDSMLVLWGILLVFSIGGSTSFWINLSRGLMPLQEFIARGSSLLESDTFRPVTPLSLDELGEFTHRLNAVEKRGFELMASLRRSEWMLKQAERMARIGQWRNDLDGTVWLSEEIAEMLNMHPDDLPTTNEGFFDLVHPDDVDKLRNETSRTMTTATGFSAVHRLIRGDGTVINVISKGEYQMDEYGQPIALVGIMQDITATLELEDKLRQAQKMEAIGNLSGGIAHDFNNLLAVILGNLELIQEAETLEEVAPLVTAAIQATDRGAELTRNMLTFARKARLNPVNLDPNSLARGIESWAGRVLPKNITVNFLLDPDIWRMRADPNTTETALLNLILNARDAMPSGGTLTIETRNVRLGFEEWSRRTDILEPGPYVMLSVRDTGTGIPEDELDRIFDPFFTTKPVGKGSGLGLSMVQGFMTQSGGAVQVYSEPGVGTAIKLYFRAEVGIHQIEDAPQDMAIAQDLTEQAKVFIVEDDPGVLNVLTTSLEKVGYCVRSAKSGDAAFERLKDDDVYEVLITDIVMPGNLQGTDLAGELRRIRPEIQVIFMSGYSDEALEGDLDTHPDDIRLVKPVSRASLIAAIEQSLAKIPEAV